MYSLSRVAEEMGCRLGETVGFQVGRQQEQDSRYNNDTDILFCTTGMCPNDRKIRICPNL